MRFLSFKIPSKLLAAREVQQEKRGPGTRKAHTTISVKRLTHSTNILPPPTTNPRPREVAISLSLYRVYRRVDHDFHRSEWKRQGQHRTRGHPAVQTANGHRDNPHPCFAAHFEGALLELVQRAVGRARAFGKGDQRAARSEGVDLQEYVGK